MKIKSIVIKVTAAVCLAALILIFIKDHKAYANVQIFSPSVTLSGGLVTATSSISAIGLAVGTSTLTFDSYNTGQPFAVAGATLLVIDTASSSAAVLNINLQYSQNGVDWYQDNINVATTSQAINLTVPVSYKYTAPSTASTTAFAFPFLTPVRYTRIVFSGTGATSSIYAQVTPRREIVQ